MVSSCCKQPCYHAEKGGKREEVVFDEGDILIAWIHQRAFLDFQALRMHSRTRSAEGGGCGEGFGPLPKEHHIAA